MNTDERKSGGGREFLQVNFLTPGGRLRGRREGEFLQPDHILISAAPVSFPIAASLILSLRVSPPTGRRRMTFGDDWSGGGGGKGGG